MVACTPPPKSNHPWSSCLTQTNQPTNQWRCFLHLLDLGHNRVSQWNTLQKSHHFPICGRHCSCVCKCRISWVTFGLRPSRRELLMLALFYSVPHRQQSCAAICLDVSFCSSLQRPLMSACLLLICQLSPAAHPCETHRAVSLHPLLSFSVTLLTVSFLRSLFSLFLSVSPQPPPRPQPSWHNEQIMRHAVPDLDTASPSSSYLLRVWVHINCRAAAFQFRCKAGTNTVWAVKVSQMASYWHDRSNLLWNQFLQRMHWSKFSELRRMSVSLFETHFSEGCLAKDVLGVLSPTVHAISILFLYIYLHRLT